MFCLVIHCMPTLSIIFYNNYKQNRAQINEIIIKINISHGDKEMGLRRNLKTVKKVKFFHNFGAAAEKAQHLLVPGRSSRSLNECLWLRDAEQATITEVFKNESPNKMGLN